jgi:DNA-binding transcriptional regulator YiaG
VALRNPLSIERRIAVRRIQKAAAEAESNALIKKWNDIAATVMADLRHEAELTQEEVAQRLGWQRQRVARIERRRPMSIGEFIVLVRGIGKEPDNMLTRVLAPK